MAQFSFSIGQCATLACLLEATAPKPGNVHRGADFIDLHFNDFLTSAVAIGPVMDAAERQGLGRTILEAVRATRRVVDRNTNLGTILLLAPLAAVPRSSPLDFVARVLDNLEAQDASDVYEAIRLAGPGGLSKVESMDIADSPPSDLRAAMLQAAQRDLVARQYSNGFAEVLNCVVPGILAGRQAGWSLTTAIIHTHVQLMSCEPDSLIARKCGAATAQRSAELARAVLQAGPPDSETYQRALSDLDFWLRSDHNRRNPGTTADLIAAGLFACLRDDRIHPPLR
jgi:triphosphoribosyl-dephospho-CoA synthase